MGEITEETAENVINFSLSEKSDQFNYVILSSGGDMDAALAIVDVMQWLINEGKVVRTISIGKSHSAAAIIFAFGAERIIGKHSSLLFHQPNITEEVPEKLSSHRRYFNFESKRWVEFLDNLAKKCGQNEKKFRSKVNQDLWLSPQEAIAMGIADRIL